MDNPLSVVTDPIIESILESATSVIKNECGGFFHGVKEEVKKLSSNLTAIQATLKMAEEKQLEETHLRDWLMKLKNALWDVEDVLETFKADASLWKTKQEVRWFKPPFSLSKACYEYDADHRIKRVVSKLEDIAAEKKNFYHDVNVGEGRPLKNSQVHSIETACIFGREDDKKRIVDDLLFDEPDDKQRKVSLFPIVGMGGLGKTTLARLVYNDSRVEKHFEFRMWVSVTIQFDRTQILREMMEPYLEMDVLSNLSHLSPALVESHFREFLPGKRFLLVLDDVWSVDYNNHWRPLLQLLEMGEIGSKVVITTRYQKVAEIVEAQPPYLLDCLPENECWSLFKNIAFRSGNLPDDLEDIGRKIVNKCKGLPLAVKDMGHLLRGNFEVSKWRKVMNSSIMELGDSNSLDILPHLKVSYYYLSSHLRQCFAFCSIFPKGYTFDKEEIVKLWMAQGFIQSNNQERVEKIGMEYFDELLARFFFQVSKVDDKVQYGMHDSIHDLAQSVSSTYCYQVKDMKSCSFSEDYRHMSLLCQDVEQSSLKIVHGSSKLRTLLLPGDHVKDFGQALGKMFQTLKYIRLLDLSSSTILNLPNSIEELKLLRYLDLSKSEIKVLPGSLCNLYNLQTLKLLVCPWLLALPKNFGKLVNLHYLELDEIFWFKCKSLPPRMGKLTSLRTLPAFRVGRKTGYRIEELKDMAYLTGTLHISMLENTVNAKEARLNEKESLRKLVLEWSNRDINPHDQAAEEILEALVPHSNIEELQICNYRGMEFPIWIRSDDLLRNLVILTLNHCTRSKTLTLCQLPNLVALNIKGLLELEEWPNVHCPSLERLKICDCPKLRKLPDIFHKLGTLKITRCNSLTVLHAQNLQHLALEALSDGTLLSMVPNTSSLYSLLVSNIANLVSFPKWPHLPGLKALYIHSCKELVSLSQAERPLRSLTSLKLMSIKDCPKLEALPDEGLPASLECLSINSCAGLDSLGSEILRSLTSLKDFYIQDCPLIHSFPEDGLPDSLQQLYLKNCPSLTKKCQNNGGTEWPKIMHIPDLEIDSTRMLTPDSAPWY